MFICGIHALRLFRQKEATVIIFSKVSSKTAKTKILDLQKNWKNKLGKSGLFLLKFYIVQINTAAQLAFTSSKLKIEQGVKYVKS